MWAQEATNDASFPATGAILLIGAVIFLLGHRLAVAQRANRDYKTVKAAVKPARKTFWAAVGATIKFFVLCSIAGLLLLAWLIHDVRANAAGH